MTVQRSGPDLLRWDDVRRAAALWSAHLTDDPAGYALALRETGVRSTELVRALLLVAQSAVADVHTHEAIDAFRQWAVGAASEDPWSVVPLEPDLPALDTGRAA